MGSGGCCAGCFGHKVHPDISKNLEPVTDCSTFFALQQFIDQTFRDRPYVGIYKPKFLTLREAYRVRNADAERAYVEKRKSLQDKTPDPSSQRMQTPVITERECPVALRKDLECWGLDDPLDPAIR